MDGRIVGTFAATVTLIALGFVALGLFTSVAGGLIGGDRRATRSATRPLSGATMQASMTAKEALDSAIDTQPGARLRRYEMTCGPRGSCRREPLVNDAGRWTWCPDCLTVYDDYRKAWNQMRDFMPVRGLIC